MGAVGGLRLHLLALVVAGDAGRGGGGMGLIGLQVSIVSATAHGRRLWADCDACSTRPGVGRCGREGVRGGEGVRGREGGSER